MGHLKEAAAAFAQAGELEAYVSTVGFGPRDIEKLDRRLPRPLAHRLTRELKRRAVADEVGERSSRVATGWEIGNVLLSRAPLPLRFKHAAFKPTRLAFDRRAAEKLTPATGAVLGYQGATTFTFQRARQLGISTVLDYPIAHYELTERLLEEEARLVPEYAPTMRVTRYPDWVRRRYAEEMALADRIIMVSEHHQRTFEEAGVDPSRLFIVPWYVDCELFAPPESEQPDRPFRIAFLGQITQRKGISYLIDGFQRAGLDDAELVLIGAPIGTSAPWAGKPGIRHQPPLPRFMVPSVLRECHVIALPSLIEGFPISVLEGMACGLPAIISENLGHDFVEEGVDGYVVPIRDPDAIAERLRELHADTNRRREMSRAARVKAEQFTLERYRENLRGGVGQLLADRVAAG
jgi:glycosyltransferase involved in cell wall biosynthesis